MAKALVIGGSGFAGKLEKMGGKWEEMGTRFGKVDVFVSGYKEKEIFAIMRHGLKHDTPPHKVNYKANIAFAKKIGADAILASTAVGVISDKYAPGDLILCNDMIGLNLVLGGSPVTFFDSFADGPHHADASEPFSRKLNELMLKSALELGMELKTGAVLTLTYGPRYESPAEIRALRTLGADLTGMTAVFEASLALEQGTPYSVCAIGTNWAAGLGGKPLSHDEVIEMMSKRGDDLFSLMMKTIEIL